ncbi:MAG: tripartite tricarboxylate transporter TctB family protein [Betaproteobacteria bacterium]|nr:tripartite tricarboxylate transporter TctB family protein [Betaproteobacteria bacterium]
MRIGSSRLRVEWGHLAFVLAIAAFCAWYWLDARAASTSTQNLLLIQPAALLALFLCAVIATRLVNVERVADEAKSGEESAGAAAPWEALRHSGALRGVLFAALLGAYVAAVLFAGFDLATFVFLAAGMFLLGERRPLVLVGFAALFAAALSYSFKNMLSVPVPTIFF